MATLDEIIVSNDNNLAEVFVKTVGDNTDGILVFGAGVAHLAPSPVAIDVTVLKVKGNCRLKTAGINNLLTNGELVVLEADTNYTVETSAGGYCVLLATHPDNAPGNHPRPGGTN